MRYGTKPHMMRHPVTGMWMCGLDIHFVKTGYTIHLMGTGSTPVAAYRAFEQDRFDKSTNRTIHLGTAGEKVCRTADTFDVLRFRQASRIELSESMKETVRGMAKRSAQRTFSDNLPAARRHINRLALDFLTRKPT